MVKTAIVKTGGKQYKVKEKQVLKIEKIAGEKDSDVEFKDILMIFDDEEKEIKMGNPLVEGASVKGKIVEQGRDKKINVIKYKSKTRHRVKQGHRQHYTKVEISAIKA